jgi:hypothetical protein
MFNNANDDEDHPPQIPSEAYSLPAPKSVPMDPSNPPTHAGWWNDPLSSDEITQRYYDGMQWTQYVSIRTPQRWTDAFPDRVNTQVDPEALGIPRPPAAPDSPSDPPTLGWWKDPIERKLKQARYFDGTHWTDLVAPTKSAGPRLVTRRRDPKEVIQEHKAPRSAAKAENPDAASGRRRWPWSRRGA